MNSAILLFLGVIIVLLSAILYMNITKTPTAVQTTPVVIERTVPAVRRGWLPYDGWYGPPYGFRRRFFW